MSSSSEVPRNKAQAALAEVWTRHEAVTEDTWRSLPQQQRLLVLQSIQTLLQERVQGSDPKYLLSLCPELTTDALPNLAKENKLIDLIRVRVSDPKGCKGHDEKFITHSAPESAAKEKIEALVDDRTSYVCTFLCDTLTYLSTLSTKDQGEQKEGKSEEGIIQPGTLSGPPPQEASQYIESSLGIIDESTVEKQPMMEFAKWMKEADKLGLIPPHGQPMMLATCTADGFPSSRIVLLKSYDDSHFVFYTNLASRKGQEISNNPNVALLFFWETMDGGRQVRVEGKATPMSGEESDEYWNSRPVGSRVSACVSLQSQQVGSREELHERAKNLKTVLDKSPDSESVLLRRPDTWRGVRVTPLHIEFWNGRPSRLHDRLRFSRESVESQEWRIQRLYP